MTDETSGELAFFRDLGGDKLVEEVRQYEAYLRQEQAQRPAEGEWQALGNVLDATPYDGGLRLACEGGYADVRWFGPSCVQVRVRQDNEFDEPFSYAVRATPAPVEYEGRQSRKAFILSTDVLLCRIEMQPFSVELQWHNGRSLGGKATHLARAEQGATHLSMQMRDDETSYGTGERSAGLNLRGQRVALWNTDQPNTDPGVDPLYYNVPFYLGVHEYGTYGVFWDNSARGLIDIGAQDPDRLCFQSERGELRYYLMAGETAQQVLETYADLTGTPPLPPLWYLGYHQSRFSYFTQEDVLEVAREMRDRGIPCDALYLDIHYLDEYKVLSWSKDRFPDLPSMLMQLHRMGFRLVAILDPAVKIEDGFVPYEDGLQRDVFVKTPDGEPLQVVVWSGASHLPDFSKEGTADWWSGHLKPIIEAGVDGFWNDMNEPAVFATTGAVTLPDSARFDADGRELSHVEMHNPYGMLMATATRQALEEHRPGKRQVNISRAGYAGMQRVASSWTGDITSDWDHLRMSIPMLLNLGLSGVPFSGPDVGGFRYDTDAELLTRWTQAASLMPFFRNHSAIDTIRQEPWVFGDPYEGIMREAIELRYQLMPYLYSLAALAAERGIPMMRPTFMVDPDDASLRSVDDQFMVGDALLVAPVLEAGATERRVTLPRGQWYDYWTGASIIGGGEHTVAAPLERLPLFVRGGAVLPMWNVQQNLSTRLPETMKLRVYRGALATSLYEDAGDGLAYQQGERRWIHLKAERAGVWFKLTRQVMGEYEPPYEKMRMEIFGFNEEPHDIRIDGQGAPVWYYENGLVDLQVGEFETLRITPQIGPSDKTVVRRSG